MTTLQNIPFLIFFFLLLSINLSAQTTIISPSIGFEHSTLNSPDRALSDHVWSRNSRKYTISYNLNIEKFLSPKLSLSFNGNLTQKRIKRFGGNAGPLLSFPLRGARFLFFKGSILLKYYPKPYLYVGLGPNKNYTFRPIYTVNFGDESSGSWSSDAYGLGLYAGGVYKNFFVEFSYNYGFENEREPVAFFLVKKINSSTALIGYRFDISKKRKRKNKKK